MKLLFERISSDDEKKIYEIYKILKECGEHMFNNHGLIHWKTPYPIESIKKNCDEREVFLAKEIESDNYVHTFQLELERSIAVINKFATTPKVSGKGIGKKSMKFIEEYCLKKNIEKIRLDVYDKSEHAIRFYKNRGFVIVDSKSTKHFNVYIMEKGITQ